MLTPDLTHGETETFEREGWTLLARVEGQDDADWPDHLGEFSDTAGPGAIDHHKTGTWLYRSTQGEEFFNPAYYKDALQHLKGGGLSDDEAIAKADEEAQSLYKRAVAYCQGDWGYVGIIVTATKANVELGDSSLWGIETDSDRGYIEEILEDLADEAIACAEERLAKLLEAVTAKKESV